MAAAEDYFSIDDILSSEPRFMSTFRVRGYQLGHLDPMGVKAALLATTSATASTNPNQRHNLRHSTTNNTDSNPSTQSTDRDSASASASASLDDDEEDHIPANHKVALPFWLAESLAERNVVTVRLPHCFQTKARHALRADASSVALYSKCPTYYALGIRVARLVKDVSLPLVLTKAFANRCWGIVDQAAYCSTRGSKALAKLDLVERRLFFVAHAVHNGVIHWKERSFDRIASFQPLLGKRPRHQEAAGAGAEESDIGSAVTPSVNRPRRVFA